ncbi:MAG: DNA polymerase III subunit delta' [Thermodesulfobacteriota bacterium]|nr:DNA polymerase III subunit delta' [Thermodesulfobacteriota bacterium]
MSFGEVIGHEKPLNLLRTMLVNDRLPHALLFTGPAGVGKRTLAVALAQAVNCLGPNPSEPCGLCSACRKIKRGVHPDFIELEPDGRLRTIKIERVRELRNKAAFRPYEGRTKVFIVREADRMGIEAANAMLKTLEEPPPDTLIILTSPEESGLLPTIVSRCLRLNLAPLPGAAIENWLIRERSADAAQARLLASLSGGCLGRAMDMDAETILSRRQWIMDKLELLDARRIEPALDWAADLAGDREAWPEVFSLLRFWFRDLMIMAGGGDERRLVNQDLAAELRSAGTGRGPENYIAALDEIDRAEDALNRLVRPELVLENLMLNLTDLGI